jgi:maltose O-acetyltransferase
VRGEPSIDKLVAEGLTHGTNLHVGHPVYVDGLHPWLITIGDHVTLAPYVSIFTHDESLKHHTGTTRLGRVDIGDRVYVGVGATILPGTSIGEDSVVGAGAVVHGEIPPSSLVVGNPGKAQPIKSVVAWSRASAKRAPSWPDEGSSIETGITEEIKREQIEALAGCAAGFVPARAAPGSPHDLKQRS